MEAKPLASNKPLSSTAQAQLPRVPSSTTNAPAAESRSSSVTANVLGAASATGTPGTANTSNTAAASADSARMSRTIVGPSEPGEFLVGSLYEKYVRIVVDCYQYMDRLRESHLGVSLMDQPGTRV